MEKYFLEIEFKTDLENIYWLPLFIEASNLNDANGMKERISIALSEHYTIQRISDTIKYKENENSDLINEYINKNLDGKIKKLNLEIWDFKNIEPMPELSFNENLELVDYDEMIFKNNTDIANTIARHQFPVKVIQSNENISDFDEFLLVNVVAPKFFTKLAGAFKNRRK